MLIIAIMAVLLGIGVLLAGMIYRTGQRILKAVEKFLDFLDSRKVVTT